MQNKMSIITKLNFIGYTSKIEKLGSHNASGEFPGTARLEELSFQFLRDIAHQFLLMGYIVLFFIEQPRGTLRFAALPLLLTVTTLWLKIRF